MEDFKYFKPIQDLQFDDRQMLVDLEPNLYEVDLFNYSLQKVKGFNFIADFDEQTFVCLSNIVANFSKINNLNLLEITEISAGFMSDYAGTVANAPALMLCATFTREGNDKILRRKICLDPYSVCVVNKYDILQDPQLTELWRNYLLARYGNKYAEACNRFAEKSLKRV